MSGRRPAPAAVPRHWNFHQLEPAWAERIVEDAGIRPGQLVVDLGAGGGALTEPLLRAGARVLAVELHAGRAATLRERLAGADCVVLTLDAEDFVYPDRPVRLVANPPFSLAATLIRRIAAAHSVVAADLVLPLSVVRRYLNGNRLGGMAVSEGRRVPSHAFRPEAPGDCRVLRLRRLRRGRARR